MGVFDVTAEKIPVGPSGVLVSGKQDGARRRHRFSFCSGDVNVPSRAVGILQKPLRNVSSSGFAEPTSVEFGSRATSRWSRNTYTSGRADTARSVVAMGDVAGSGCAAVRPDCVEVCEQVERGAVAAVGAVLGGDVGRSDRRLVGDAEGTTCGPVHSKQDGGVEGKIGGPDRTIVSSPPPLLHVDQYGYAKAGQALGKGVDPVHCAQREAWGGNVSFGDFGRRNERVGSGSGVAVGETRSGRRIITNDNSLWGRFNRSCTSFRNGEGNKMVMKGWDSCCFSYDSFLSFPQSGSSNKKHKYSVSRRAHTSKLPVTVEDRAAPLHVAPSIEPLNVKKLRSRLSVEKRKRFDYVWNCAFFPEIDKNRSVVNKKDSVFTREHADLLVKNNVASHASGAGPLLNIPFTVMEEKPSGKRQRFILWSKEANDLLNERGYVADVPLQHISAYLEAVREECASARDFKTGFYQVEIPVESRYLFRFLCDDGSWFELLRLPMGHSCAPEIMHTMAAAAAGDPLFVLPKFVPPGVIVHCWIDNIRFCGNKEMVATATKQGSKSTVCLCV